NKIFALVKDLALRHLVALAPGEHLRQRTLAGAVGTHDRMDFARVDRQIDPFQYLDSTDCRVEVLNFQQAHLLSFPFACFALPLWRLRLEQVAVLCFQRLTSIFNSWQLRLERITQRPAISVSSSPSGEKPPV